jgi:hypothetical protein
VGPVKVRPDNPYIRRLQSLTNKYKVLFVYFKTDEYNLNIFIDIEECKNTDK